MDDNDGCVVFIVLLVLMFNSCDTKNKAYNIEQKIDNINRKIDDMEKKP